MLFELDTSVVTIFLARLELRQRYRNRGNATAHSETYVEFVRRTERDE